MRRRIPAGDVIVWGAANSWVVHVADVCGRIVWASHWMPAEGLAKAYAVRVRVWQQVGA